MRALLLLALLLLPALSLATPAEETTTLSASISRSAVSGVRVTDYSRSLRDGVFRIKVQGCTSCTTASPVWLEGTETFIDVGVTNSLGPNRTTVSGYAVAVGGRNAACSVTPTQLRGFVVSAVGAGAGDPVARAAKDVVNACLGGT